MYPLFTEWGGRLKVAVIDCSESKNQETCRKYNVMGYPSVKVSVENDMMPCIQ